MSKDKFLDMNVLSIDFDYFQNTNLNCLKRCYPDGVDKVNEHSTQDWVKYYTDTKSAKELLKVDVLSREVERAKELIQKQNKNCSAMIANSHISIYNFICEKMENRNENRLWITNIDMHHDMFNNNPKLDCGNWIGHIKDRFHNTRMEWIANPVTREMYGLEDDNFNMIKTEIAAMRQKRFDAIFLCRSDNWLPPHLDNEFNKLSMCMIDTFYNIKVEHTALQERKCKELLNRTQRTLYNKANQNTIDL